MNAFDEAAHPRAAAGTFTEKLRAEPSGSLGSHDVCRDCGGRNDGGEGWDGRCGNCADRATCHRCYNDVDDPRADGLCNACAEAVSRDEQALDAVEAAFTKHFPGAVALEVDATPGDVEDGYWFETGTVTVVNADGSRQEVSIHTGERPTAIDLELATALEHVADEEYGPDPRESDRYQPAPAGSMATMQLPFRTTKRSTS